MEQNNNNNNNNKKYRLARQLPAAHTHKSYISNSSDTQKQKPERCLNPWNPSCKGTDIALDIDYEGKRRHICQKCWETISESNREWRTCISAAKGVGV
jgi:hypothetical protein